MSINTSLNLDIDMSINTSLNLDSEMSIHTSLNLDIGMCINFIFVMCLGSHVFPLDAYWPYSYTKGASTCRTRGCWDAIRRVLNTILPGLTSGLRSRCLYASQTTAPFCIIKHQRARSLAAASLESCPVSWVRL